MKRTPGPWTISESKRHPIIYILGDGRQIASTYGEGDYYYTQKPNARLIAAAPDLLAACKAVFAWHEDFESAPPLSEIMYELVEPAIAKAEGGQP